MGTLAPRRRGARLLVAGILGVVAVVLLAVAVLGALLGQGGCPQSGASAKAKDDIPAAFLTAYRQAGQRYRIPWEVLAGIGKEECDHGRNPDPSCTPQPGASGSGVANAAGAAGPMQLGVGGVAGDALAHVKVDGGGDGRIGAHDPQDAAAMAARVLLELKGAKPGEPIDGYRAAVTAYNGTGPAADAYATRVLADAHSYAAAGGASAATACAGSAAALPAGVSGPVTVALGADRPGVSIKPVVLAYVGRMAAVAGRPIVVTTGTSHDEFTVDGNESDHWTGYAADLGMVANGGTDDGAVGDRLMTACLLVAGLPESRATQEASDGGLYTTVHAGLRIQCIWKTDEGGNHHNHVHVGVRPA